MSRPGALVLLGLWLGLLAASWAMASATFRTVDRVLERARPELATRLSPLSEPDRRTVLRHLASEVNRWMFGWGAAAQLALAVVVAALLWPLGGAPRWLALAALVTVAAQAFGLGPAVRDVGIAHDFTPRPLPPDVRGRFGALHGLYVGLDLVKALLVASLTWLTARA